MPSFVYNAYQTNKVFDIVESQRQWSDYLQKKEFHDDLVGSIRSGADSYRRELKQNAESSHRDMNALRDEVSQASEQQIKAIQESSKMIVGTLEDGFGDVTSALETGLTSVSNEIENLGVMLDWRLSELIDQQRVSNLLQENIGLLLRVPDFQKERQYFIEQGFKHYKNARLDDDLYKDALKNLLEAEIREPTDYVVLHRLGMIYLYASKLIDLPKAEDYLRRAAKYAVVETNSEADRTLNILAGNIRHDFSEKPQTADAANAVAARAYFQAGVACYAQAKFGDAVELSGKAYSLLPSLLEAGFLKAKSYAVIERIPETIQTLRGVIEAGRFYSVKAVLDGDLNTKGEVHVLLAQLFNEALSRATTMLGSVESKLLPDSQIKPYLPVINGYIDKHTYLDSLKALDELTTKRQWSRPIFEGSELPLSILEFVEVEREDRVLANRNEEELARQLSEIDRKSKVKAILAHAHSVGRNLDYHKGVGSEKYWLSTGELQSFYKKAADLGDEHGKFTYECLKLTELLVQGLVELGEQKKKWFKKDYSRVDAIYDQALRIYAVLKDSKLSPGIPSYESGIYSHYWSDVLDYMYLLHLKRPLLSFEDMKFKEARPNRFDRVRKEHPELDWGPRV